jgi:membrane protein
MNDKITIKLEKIPIVRTIVRFLKKIKVPGLEGISLYEFLHMYIVGIVEGALTYHAGAVAFSFFMALFPFALFILNLIPYIPIEGFHDDFLGFVKQSVPPNTFDAIAEIINDIMNNSHSGLLSTGFILSIFLMTNGINAIIGGFQSSSNVLEKRGFFHEYFISLIMSIALSILLILTVAMIVVLEIIIQTTSIQDVLSESIPLLIIGRFIFVVLMILISTSILLRYGTIQKHKPPFISTGSIFTTILILLSSYFFGIWVVKFSKYNELYGSIGTLLIMMFYIWINCMILLLGYKLNTTIHKSKLKKQNYTFSK